MISFRVFLTIIVVAATIFRKSVVCSWSRSALIYHDANRSPESWKRNFMRISENGNFTGQWLFDHAILTTTFINGKDIMYGGLDDKDFQDLLNILLQDAISADKAITNLISSPQPQPPTKIKISLAFPYIDSQDRYVSLQGREYHLSNQSNRLDLATWYIEQVNGFRLSEKLKNVEILGLYYHREDAIDVYDDLTLIKHFNNQIHNLNMKSVWVPYNNAPHAWDGKDLGFDVLVVQPGYSLASSIDEGTVTGDRLYSIGHMSSSRSQCFEYELRGGGGSQLENWIAHQYLAIAQQTGAWKFPQVFFVGGDFFDEVSSRDNSKGDTWWAYTDLTNYLNGELINNLEVAIEIEHFKADADDGNVLKTVWKVPPGYSGLTSIRLDFNDFYGYWRGQLCVTMVKKDGSKISSFSHRFGPDSNNPNYNAVFVPLADLNIQEGTELTIQLLREFNSPWPFIFQLVGAKYEPPYISNPVYEELSNSTRSNIQGPYPDSVPSHREYSSGKFTDGKLSSNSGTWDWAGGFYVKLPNPFCRTL